MGFLDDLFKKTVVNWLAKQLNLSPQVMGSIIDGVLAFLKEVLGNMSPAEQKVFFQVAARALQNSSPVQVKAILRELQVKFQAMDKGGVQ